MLTFLGFAMVITFMFLIMTKRLSALIALIIVPILFALFGGFAPKIGPMMLEGITKLAPTGVMLMFAILYFALMIDSGLFDPAVRKILKMVKGDPLKVSVGTAVLALVVSLDGDGATTYMICVAAMLPLYQRIGMSPRIMAGLIILAGGVMNMTPWGGPTARAASALHVDPSDIFVPMIPAMAAGVVAILVIAYMYGKRERARLGELHLQGDEIDHSDISVSQFPDARRPKLIWFNGALTLALMCTLIAGLLPLPVLFMVAFSIAMIVNYPCLQQQKDRVAAHSGSVLAVVGLVDRGAQGDTGGQRDTGFGIAEHQRDVGGGGAPLAAFVAAAEHAQAVVADGARAMAAAGLRVEPDAAAVAAQQHDLQRIEQGALARAVGRDDGGGGVQFQGLRLEQEELHQVHALKLLHRRPP